MTNKHALAFWKACTLLFLMISIILAYIAYNGSKPLDCSDIKYDPDTFKRQCIIDLDGAEFDSVKSVEAQVQQGLNNGGLRRVN
jgi:hypothetical protein